MITALTVAAVAAAIVWLTERSSPRPSAIAVTVAPGRQTGAKKAAR